MREVEVKYRVDDLESVLLALKQAGIELGEPVHQDDQAYAPDGWDFGTARLGVSFLRLRTTGGRHYFAVKQPTVNAQSCLEYETLVADREAMHHAIALMGFHPTVRVVKTRRTAVFDGVSLCVDEVAGIGAFLELERLDSGDRPAGEIQAGLAAIAAGLGITARRTTDTYDTLVRAAQPAAG